MWGGGAGPSGARPGSPAGSRRQGAPRSGDQPGTVGSRWERGGHRLAGALRAAAVPATFSLQSPSPREPPYSMLSPPSALPASSILWWGAFRYLSLAPPYSGPSSPSQFPQVGQGSPQTQGLWRTGGGARARPPTSLRSWGPRGDPGRGEAAPGAASLAGSARPGSPLGGWGGGGAVTSSRGRSRLNQVEGGAGGGAPCPEGSPPTSSAHTLSARVLAGLRPSSLLLTEITTKFRIPPSLPQHTNKSWALTPTKLPLNQRTLLRLLSLQNSQIRESTPKWNLFFSHTPPKSGAFSLVILPRFQILL